MSLDVSSKSPHMHYGLLFLAHLICIDEQIHDRELKLLQAIAKELDVGDLTLQEVNKIFTQDEKQISWNRVITSIPTHDRYELMWQGLAIAHIDGFYSAPEKDKLNLLAQQWGITQPEFNSMLLQAESFAINIVKENSQEKSRLSLGANFLSRFETIISRSKLEKWTNYLPETIHQYLDRLYQEMLLAGPEYDEAVRTCEQVAKEDYCFAEPALQKTKDTLETLSANLQGVIQTLRLKLPTHGTSDSATELINSLEATCLILKEQIITDVRAVQQALLAKQRTLQYFTLAFMGKTKAGKSTLHAVITGEGWDSIGVGKQRTTRFNRVYEWKNIRVIDTPGIGAPGGKSDEDIARSILDEADTICYVVTNDSIQEVEFQFLELLKEKAKPLVVLLNLKRNLYQPKRLEQFLKNPERLFEQQGASGIGGHLNRIRRYAQEHYANDYFDIIPVMLLAAQMSRTTEDKAQSKILFKASRIQDFLDSIRLSLLEYGAIRRSQTLLGSTVGSIENPKHWISDQAKQYQVISETLIEKQSRLQAIMAQARTDGWAKLQQEMRGVFQDALATVPNFSEDFWDSSESDLKQGWDRNLKSLKFQDRLKIFQTEACQRYQKSVEESIVELGTELQIVYQLQTDGFNFFGQGVLFFERDFVRITGMIFMASGAILALFFPPLGLLGLVGGLLSWASNWFKSRDQKRREAVDKISSSLGHQLERQQLQILNQAQKNYDHYCDQVENNVSTYFDTLIQGLSGIGTQLIKSQTSLSDAAHSLNKAYAKRIIDWASGNTEPLTDQSIRTTIQSVDRIFGKQISIHAQLETPLTRPIAEIQQVLQENIEIEITSPEKVNP